MGCHRYKRQEDLVNLATDHPGTAEGTGAKHGNLLVQLPQTRDPEPVDKLARSSGATEPGHYQNQATLLNPIGQLQIISLQYRIDTFTYMHSQK